MTALALLAICAAYLVGSISSAILVCLFLRLPDPRTVGSKNPGATNIFRIGGRFPAVLVLVFDVLKGTLPVYASYWLGHPPWILGIVGIAACLGHIYPLYFGFKGGKAVATAFGTLLPLGPAVCGILIFIWAAVVFLSGYSSLGAICALFAAPMITWFFKSQYLLPVFMLSTLLLWRHRDNMRRLYLGEETSIWRGWKKR